MSYIDIGALNRPVSEFDRKRLFSLACEWAELAASEEMRDKKRWWKATNDLKMEVPLIVFEPYEVVGFVRDDEIKCGHPLLRNVERLMLYQLKQVKFISDDSVLETYFRIPWRVVLSGFGVDIVEKRLPGSIAYHSNFPIETTEDISRLKRREFIVDRERSLELRDLLTNIWGDILPVRLGNVALYCPDYGYNIYTGTNFVTLTSNLYMLLGFERLCAWMIDAPDYVHTIMRYLTDDCITLFKWLEDERLLDFNNDNQFVVPSGYGYSSEIPDTETPQPARLKDVWCRAESQESVLISPAMFEEFVLKYLAELCDMFALSGYGCCEPIEDRIELVKQMIPNVRKFSVTHWNKSPEIIAESIGKDYVYITKPFPSYLSGTTPDWDSAKQELERYWACTKDKNVEFVFRDCIDIRDLETIPKCVELCRNITGR